MTAKGIVSIIVFALFSLFFQFILDGSPNLLPPFQSIPGSQKPTSET
jgi:hypothetical protein